MILAAESCDVVNEVICAPANVTELFEFPTIFTVGGLEFSRSSVLMLFAAFVVLALFYFGLRQQRLVPTKFGVAIEGAIGFVRDGIGRDVIGPEGARYTPYLLAMFSFLLVGNLFEVTPLINFPVTSRMAIPAFLSLTTYLIFMFLGFARNNFRYLIDTVWPKAVPVGLRWLVGLIELFSIFLLRPLTLAVRLFANMVAGHLMLSLLLGSGVVFLAAVPEIGLKGSIGLFWFALGLFMFLLELVVSVLQAYIFTLLTAVYIESSIHFEH
ncbi:MAG: F0F1 ATP synthase subunit A [Actinobacteria bacterium]|nr:F0F1 ATP synthase subunit A [Actinomycetota bacterium]MCI0544046.1 F0F1 ATP synthase subunit A [Actinomycetota bacterium]MCI0678392.1 F0F1 ATP synthase subunit A [Actinomycetota bacterium]